MNKSARFALMGAALGLLSPLASGAESCVKLSSSVKEAISSKPSDLLQIVERNISANPTCACEVVKAAIEAAQPNADTVASIVQTASTAAPDQMRLIAQCSLAAAPDAINQVQAVLAKLDPGTGSGSYSAKEAGSYLFAKNIRLGQAVPTDSPKHYRVVDTNGTFLGDLRAGTTADSRVRATGNDVGARWTYFAHVPVPGDGFKKDGVGYIVIRVAENQNFYIQFDDDSFNPLDLPGTTFGELSTPPSGGGGGLLPPGPTPTLPPVLSPPVVTPTGPSPT